MYPAALSPSTLRLASTRRGRDVDDGTELT